MLSTRLLYGPPAFPPPPLQPVCARLSRHSGTAPRLPAVGRGQCCRRIPNIGMSSGEKPSAGCNKLAPCSLCNQQHPKRRRRRKEPTASAQPAAESRRGGVGRGQRPSNCLVFLLCCLPERTGKVWIGSNAIELIAQLSTSPVL